MTLVLTRTRSPIELMGTRSPKLLKRAQNFRILIPINDKKPSPRLLLKIAQGLNGSRPYRHDEREIGDAQGGFNGNWKFFDGKARAREMRPKNPK